MDSLAVLTTWAEQQSDRELSMLRLAIAYHMHKSGLSELTLSLSDVTALVDTHSCAFMLDGSGRMRFTLTPRTGAVSAAPA